MRVMRALIFMPCALPTATMLRANVAGVVQVGHEGSAAALHINTSASAPPANFFDMMLAVIRGMDSTVAVTSRRRRACGPRGRNRRWRGIGKAHLGQALDDSASVNSTFMPGMARICPRCRRCGPGRGR